MAHILLCDTVMNRIALLGAFGALAVLAPRLAGAQLLCPTADIGKPCAEGTCVGGTCTNVPSDAETISGACAFCVPISGTYCPSDQVGQPCGDGGVCSAVGGGAGGGATGGLDGSIIDALPVSFSYSYNACVPKVEPSPPEFAECPIGNIGKTCQTGRACPAIIGVNCFGECVPALCTDEAGSRACAACLDIADVPFCRFDQEGKPCSDGGTCLGATGVVGIGNGSLICPMYGTCQDGATDSGMPSPVTVCELPDAGHGAPAKGTAATRGASDAASPVLTAMNGDDATTSETDGGSTSMGSTSNSPAANGAPSPEAHSAGGGCTVAAHGTCGNLMVAAWIAAAMLGARRRSHRTRSI